MAEFETPAAQVDDALLRHAGAWGDLLSDEEIDRMLDLVYAERERNSEPPPRLTTEDLP